MAGNSTISITYKFKGDNSGLKNLVSDVENLQKAFDRGFESSDKLKGNLINWNQVAQSFDSIGQSVMSLNNVIQDLSGAYAVQIQAETQLETVMRQRMGATEEMIQSIKELCSEQQQLGVIGDEVQLAGAQQLATFLETDDALKSLIPAMNNLAAQQKGLNATSGDLVSIGNLMGKVMQGQTSALKRVGISFSEAEEAALKNGNEQERAAILAQIITNNVGEMNAALAATDAGKQKQMANAMGDLKEQLGGIVSGIAPYTSFASSIITTAANASRAAASFKALGAACFGANGFLKAINASSMAAAFGMNAAGVAAKTLAVAIRAIVSATIIGAAIEGLVWVIEKLTTSSTSATKAIEGLSEAEQKAANAARQEADERGRVSGQIETDIAKLKTFTGDKVKEKKIVEELNNRYGETMGYFKSVAEWYNALTNNSKAYVAQMVAETRARRIANEIANYQDNIDNLRKLNSQTYTLGGKRMQNPYAEMNNQQIAWSEAKIAELQKKIEDIYRNVPKMTVKGSSTAPNLNATTSRTANTTNTTSAERELNVLEQIEAQIRANEVAALSADAEQLTSLRESTQALIAQRDALKQKQDYLSEGATYTPPQIEEIKTYAELSDALRYWQDQFSNAQEAERGEIHKTITSLNELQQKWDDTFKMTEDPPSLQDAEMGLQKYTASASQTVEKFSSLWGNVKSVSSAISGLTDTLQGNGTAWEKIIGFIDAFIAIFQGVKGVIDIITAMTTVTQTLTGAQQAQTSMTVAGASAEVSANTQKAASARMAANANMTEAASGAMAAHSAIPWVGVALGIAAVAAMIATMASLPKYAKGGLAFGPTVGMFGEYAGAANNPEVVAPLNKLKEYIGQEDGGESLTCSISMNELRFYLNRSNRKISRM